MSMRQFSTYIPPGHCNPNTARLIHMMKVYIKKAVIIILLFAPLLGATAQHAGTVANTPLTTAIRDIATGFDNKIPADTKVVGIGNVTPFARESTELSMAIAGFLVSQKKFRHIVLLYEDWLLRPLNDYLTDKRPFDSTTVDSLVRISLANSSSRNTSFSSFAIWLKKYNLDHSESMVDISGIVADDLIPPAYFLATYIFPADRTSGLMLSKKWGANSYDDESAFKDITTWYQQVSKNTALFNKHKALLVRCAEDIEHNDIIRKGSSLIMKPKVLIDLKTRAMAGLVQKKSDRQTIIYANNEDIARAAFVFNGDTLTSLGLLLHEQLKDRYYSCLTDFGAPSDLNQIDAQTGQLTVTTIPGSEYLQVLSRKKPAFFMPEDKQDFKQYRPRTIFPVIGIEREIVTNSDLPAADALFIIKHLSSTGFLKRITDIAF
ncbi:hypothetical protein CTE07_52870 [Chitinophaga terrae (ex Kim and Jung 2007)]|nr:hypothetical protein CTE07_52870 [Chitinophaga terrae (ex Kim and Jung 2007)]